MQTFNKQTSEGERLIKALLFLQSNREYLIYLESLEKTLLDLRKRNDHLTGDSLKWNQGKCQILQEIINHPKVVKKIKQSK